MTPKDAYEWLRLWSIDTAGWRSLRDLAAWDQRTGLPAKGHARRADQLAHLAVLIHERTTDPRVGEHLHIAAEGDAAADPESAEAVNLREWRRAYDRLTKIPRSLEEALARACAEGETAWEVAREKSDWQGFRPHFEIILSLSKERADAIGYSNEPYDALLDDYEPGESAASIERIFAALTTPLIELTQRIAESDITPDTRLLTRVCPIPAQKAFSKRIAALLGFDFEAGRLDESVHPFTIGITPKDVRITTRYHERALLSALLGTIHETGHGLYEQGLEERHYGTPMGETASLGVHESQSRFYENFIGRSHRFWQLVLPIAQQTFETLRDVSLDDFVLATNAVAPSLIRVEADEVTYNLHIVMRFELELMLLRGQLTVADLPEAWNQKMKHFFGIEPPDARSGVLQDVHWAAGLIGYFPTYTLGNLYAAQLFQAVEAEIDTRDGFTEERLREVLRWLREKVHIHGSARRPRDLIERASGLPLDPGHFLEYCEQKYSALFHLEAPA